MTQTHFSQLLIRDDNKDKLNVTDLGYKSGAVE